MLSPVNNSAAKLNSKKNKSNLLCGSVGIFDSGVGGLSIAKCIAKALPHENIIYFSDNQYAPYGDKSQHEIIKRVNHVSETLINLDVKALVIACNTATVNAIDQLRATYKISAPHLPIIGVEPAIKPAAILSKSRKVAVLATAATATNQRFIELVARHKGSAEVIIQPCPGLVELIELGQQHTTTCQNLIKSFVAPLITQGVDTLVLGCTHYPFLRQYIQTIAGENITIMETAEPVTQQLIRQLERYEIRSPSNTTGNHYFYCSAQSNTTKHTKNTQQLMSELWQNPISLLPSLNLG